MTCTKGYELYRTGAGRLFEKISFKIQFAAIEERRRQIDAVEERLSAKIDQLDNKIDAVEERLSVKIDFVEAKMDTKFQFHDKLLWTIIGLLIALSGFVVTNSIFIYDCFLFDIFLRAK